MEFRIQCPVIKTQWHWGYLFLRCKFVRFAMSTQPLQFISNMLDDIAKRTYLRLKESL